MEAETETEIKEGQKSLLFLFQFKTSMIMIILLYVPKTMLRLTDDAICITVFWGSFLSTLTHIASNSG